MFMILFDFEDLDSLILVTNSSTGDQSIRIVSFFMKWLANREVR